MLLNQILEIREIIQDESSVNLGTLYQSAPTRMSLSRWPNLVPSPALFIRCPIIITQMIMGHWDGPFDEAFPLYPTQDFHQQPWAQRTRGRKGLESPITNAILGRYWLFPVCNRSPTRYGSPSLLNLVCWASVSQGSISCYLILYDQMQKERRNQILRLFPASSSISSYMIQLNYRNISNMRYINKIYQRILYLYWHRI